MAESLATFAQTSECFLSSLGEDTVFCEGISQALMGPFECNN